MKRPAAAFIVCLFALRVAVSFAFSDGRFKSDSLTYYGAVVNLGLNGSMSSIQPEDEKRFAGGADASELYEHLKGIRDPLYRPLGFQWLHSALYAPILFFWKSLTPVIIINNLLFFGAGIFFFRAVRTTVGPAAQYAAWIVLAFFPPFFYLTSQFFSEPLFLFLFGGLILFSEREGNEQFFLLFLAACALSLTRPFGIVIVLALAFYMLVHVRIARALGLVSAVGLAVGINAVVMLNACPPNARIHAVAAAETFYCTNSTVGNGDFDLYFDVPEVAAADTTLQAFRSGAISGPALMDEAVLQNVRAPEKFAANSVNKLSNYFFSIVPEAWTYPGMRTQTLEKKLLWAGQTLCFYALLAFGIAKSRPADRRLYAFIYVVGLVFHFFLLARYRYMLPMLVYGAAFLAPAFERFMPRSLKHRSPL